MKKKILLTILPYWDPMIPPLGITSLKRFLEKHDYEVKTEDIIVRNESLDFYGNYFKVLKEIVPLEKRGNFNNIGHDVLLNHMMSYQTFQNEEEYCSLTKLLIYNHYYVEPEDKHIKQLNNIVHVFYADLTSYFIKLLDDYKPDVLGVTAFKGTIAASLFVLKLTRERYPNIKTLMGGGTFNESHAPDSPSFDALLEYSKYFLDKIILGKGEIVFLKYLEGELPENKRVYTMADVNNQMLPFQDRDVPDFSDIDLKKYPCLAATASEGCIYDCSFCVAKRVGGAYRAKDPELLNNEMTLMHNMHKHQLFFLTDSLVNPVLTDISNEFIKTNKSFYFDTYFKVDDQSADIRNTMLWRKGGLYRVRLGTESGSQKILDYMDKKITVEQIRKTVSALAYAGIKTTTYWVIGHPGETEEDFQETLDLVEELKNDIFQAECNYFLYHYSQQASADSWAKFREPLYPEWADKMLVFKYWTLNIDPVREETFNRVHRFEAHCRKLGIPNPYSYNEHNEADFRWRKLHPNAVPPLVDFLRRDKYIDENLTIQVPQYAASKLKEEVNFTF